MRVYGAIKNQVRKATSHLFCLIVPALTLAGWEILRGDRSPSDTSVEPHEDHQTAPPLLISSDAPSGASGLVAPRADLLLILLVC
jgi:hypothetical protein